MANLYSTYSLANTRPLKAKGGVSMQLVVWPQCSLKAEKFTENQMTDRMEW